MYLLSALCELCNHVECMKKKNIQGHSVVRAYLLNFFVILLYLLTAFASIHSNSVLAFS